MKNQILAIGATVALLGGCGGTQPPAQESTVPAATDSSAPAMTSILLTMAVDDKGDSAAPASTEFGRDTEQIYVIAELTDLPPDTKVSISWNAANGSDPIARSLGTASGDHKLVTRISAPSGGFEVGNYQVFVYADKTRLGQTKFHIGGKAEKWTGVRGLLVSSAITAWTNEPIESRTSFPKGTKRVYAGFQVRTNDPNPYVTVIWLQGERELARGDLECAREVRCIDSFEKGKQLPPGDYQIEIEVNGEFMSRRSFHVGGNSISPMIVHAALGPAGGKKKMPKRHTQEFKKRPKGLRCGVRIATLPDEAVLKVTWIALTEDGDVERFKAQEIIKGGGTQTAVVDWPIEGAFDPGRYKAVIHLGSRLLEELPFTVK